jgi:CheY-like chemotaxis protein
VLVVEDEPALRETLAFALEHFDFTVLEAGDGIEAMELFRQHRDEIGCVLCDVAMPRMDGWETLTALRQLAPQLPVILASGYDEAQVMRGDHPERPQAFLKKPFDLKVCINTVRLLTTTCADPFSCFMSSEATKQLPVNADVSVH